MVEEEVTSERTDHVTSGPEATSERTDHMISGSEVTSKRTIVKSERIDHVIEEEDTILQDCEVENAVFSIVDSWACN